MMLICTGYSSHVFFFIFPSSIIFFVKVDMSKNGQRGITLTIFKCVQKHKRSLIIIDIKSEVYNTMYMYKDI